MNSIRFSCFKFLKFILLSTSLISGSLRSDTVTMETLISTMTKTSVLTIAVSVIVSCGVLQKSTFPDASTKPQYPQYSDYEGAESQQSSPAQRPNTIYPTNAEAPTTPTIVRPVLLQAKLPDAILQPLQPPVVVVMSGWNSCGTALTPASSGSYAMSLEYIKKISRKFQNAEIPYVLSCFRFNKFIDNGVRAVTSASPSTVRTMNTQQVVSKISELAARYNRRDVVLIGHSMGGTEVVKVAQLLPQNLQLKLLITLDPISQFACNYLFMSTSILNLRPDPGCTTYPQEFSDSTQVTVKNKVRSSGGRWFNLYQKNFSFLHSDEVLQASENIQVFHSGANIEAHNALNSSAETWNFIFQKSI